MKELLYGAAYYDEYMPYDRLDKDIEMIKAANMNVVRIAESTWSTLEPKEGEFNFYHIDRVLDAMEKADIYVIIGTPTYAIPPWLANKDKEILTLTKDGQSLYGHRQNMDITNQTFRYYSQRMIHKLISHVSHRAGVIGYQIDNETKHYGSAGPYIQGLFKDYLKEKFVTVENLNEEFGLAYWSNSLGSWNDLTDIRGTINGSLACEFEKFQRTLAAQYLGWQAEIINQYKREDQFITHNFDYQWKKFGADIAQDGYSYGVQPDINHFESAKHVTLAGTDIYHMTQDQLTGAEIAFGGDINRSLKQNNYLVLEAQAQAFKYWTPYDGQLRLQAFSHIASGANGLMYWHWHSIHNGFETYWKGLLSHDMKSNPTYEEAKIVGKEFKEHKKDLVNLKKHNKVAMLISNESLTSFKWFPIDKDLSYNDVFRWMYDSLYEMNVECDILFPESDNIEDYELIIIPALYSAPKSLLKRLNKFVENGGSLIASFKTAVANEHVTVYHEDLPYLLSDCFGITYNQFSEPRDVTIEGLAIDDKEKKVSYWMELLNIKTAQAIAKYNHKYWGKYAAITSNSYGKGNAYYIGCYTSKEALKEIYKLALTKACLEDEIQSYTWPITIRKAVNEEGYNIYFYMNYSSDDKTLICPYTQVTDILTEKTYKKGDTIYLRDWDLCILKE